MFPESLSRRDGLFVVVCVVAYMAAALLTPPYVALVEPDSASYLEFSPLRTALYPAFLFMGRAAGLDLVAITWVQVGIFGLALAYLLVALRRAGFPRWLLAILVAALAGNVLFTAFHRSILTESLYFSVSVVAVGLWIDYFRSGRLRFLILSGLALGLLIGIRPAGLGLVPMHLFAAWIRRPQRTSTWLLLAAVVLPVAVGAGSERAIYHAVHGNASASTAPHLLIGMAAMLVKPDMTFTGPHAAVLRPLGAQLYAKYYPAQGYLAEAPSLAVRAHLSAAYQGEAQFGAWTENVIAAASSAGVPSADLIADLGKQVILQNLPGYLKLTLVNLFGQWSVAAQNFPPTARLLAAYADANPAIGLGGRLPYEILHPKPSLVSAIVYPAFLIAGAVTLALSVGFLVFLWRPALMDTTPGFYLGLATFFSAMCHGYLLFISLINVWTPRFLMAVFPQLEIVALCIVLALMRWWTSPRTRDERAG